MTKQAKVGTLYFFRLSHSSFYYADPASRYQPHGPKGPSCVVKSNFHWTDTQWKGIEPYNHVAYELHIGTFTEQGTFKAAMKKLQYLADLGITLIEMMPIADFPGHFGWGYDGVNLFAPSHLYGTPDDLKTLIDQAHKLGIGILLDVVYNHLGPEDSPLIYFANEYLNSKYVTDWGEAINFDSVYSREFFITNSEY